MKLYAFRGEMSSDGKIALGPFLFSLKPNLVLDPQPTEQQIAEYRLLPMLAEVVVPDEAQADVADPQPNTPSFGRIPVLAVAPNVLEGMLLDDEEEDDEPTPGPMKGPKAVDLKELTLVELRSLCESKGVKYEASATKAKLIALLSKV